MQSGQPPDLNVDRDMHGSSPGPIFLGGGGRFSYRELDEEFLTWVAGRPISYWPIALDPAERSYEVSLNELTTRLSLHGRVGIVRMWNGNARSDPHIEVGRCAAIYIDGGNAYRLLAGLKRNKMIRLLRRFVTHGGGLYGDSAGAALLGADVDTVAELDPNEVGLRDTRAANLVNDCGIFVHYDVDRRSDPRAWVRQHRRPAIALCEKTGAVLRGRQLSVVGTQSAWHFAPNHTDELRPGTTHFLSRSRQSTG